MKSKFTAREAAEVLAGLLIRRLGGQGSGNFGHAGRPGQVGGSASVTIPHVGGSKTYKFSPQVTALADDDNFVWESDLLPTFDGKRPAGFSDTDNASAKNAAAKFNALAKKHGLETAVAVPLTRGNTRLGLAVVSRDLLEDKDYPEFIKATVGYMSGDDLSDKQQYVLGKWLGYPEASTKKFIAQLKQRNLAAGEDSLLHKAADAHVPDLKVALRYAFAATRAQLKDLKPEELEEQLPKILQQELEAVLPGALTRAAVSGASIALRMRNLGGKGSGNFGHAGRPGFVGGSASDEYPEGLTKLSGAKGSNPGGVFRDKDGKKWYVKQYKNADQAAGEHIANAVYSRIGVDAADSRLSSDGKSIALRWEDGLVLNQHGLDSGTANRILDGFAGDVLLQNWDAVGLGHDNVLVRADGSVMRVDQGGTLLHRAQGALKPEAGRHKIDEWDSLRTFNPYYAQVFHQAGVASGDALGERVAKQIDRITHGRPEGGWAALVSEVAPLASPSYKKAVSEMLEARQGLLEKKREALRMKSLGGPGSGHFGHSGGKGGEGNPGGSNDGDTVIIKKAKAPAATKDQIATAVQMKADGKSYAEIQAKTGLNPKQAATIVHKHKKAQGAAFKAITTPSNDWAKKPVAPVENKPSGHGPIVDDALAQGYEWKQTTEGVFKGEWAFFNSNGMQVSPHFSKSEIVHAAVQIKDPLKSEAPAATTPVEHTLDTLKAKGYEWKEKTTGPNKGNYAFFKNGVQVSSFSPKDIWKTAVPTINNNKGPDYVAPAPTPPPPKPGTIGESGLHAEVVGKAEVLAPWPITDDVSRVMGSTTPKILKARGEVWATTLTSAEKDAVAHYTGSGSSHINKPLTYGTKISKYTKDVDSALAKADPPPPPDLVWRGVSSVDPHKLIASLETGDIISLKSFQSTSINPETGHGWSGGKTLFEIKPKKGAFVKPVSYHAHEHEFLLPRGAHYIVRGAKKVKFGTDVHHKFIIQLEML